MSPFSCQETLLAWYDIKKVIRLWVFVGSHITSPFTIAVGRYSRGAAPQKAQMGTDWVAELETNSNCLFEVSLLLTISDNLSPLPVFLFDIVCNVHRCPPIPSFEYDKGEFRSGAARSC